MSSLKSRGHRRTLSRESTGSNPPRSPSPTTLTYHPTILPIPTPALVESVAGAAHYSGVRLEHMSSLKRRRSSHDAGDVHTQLKPSHQRVLEDLRELYECRPTLEIFERSWNKNAEFEVRFFESLGYIYLRSSRTLCRSVMATLTYTTRLIKRQKIINSIVIVDLDEDEKIIRMVDQWDGKELPSWFGAHFLRVLNAKVTPWLVSVPKRTAS
ncbi:hypothetical protein H0H81_010796 [Sphagnurus paluster]|uniref:Uncharacterized protein n=1 Tax=Sphagnurus paluster TaxID=117069 RepID=A0A9P7FWE3_9AGAR|nr:hypothetical protein H0H81_010796 [Sphagnurus paluster]